MIHAMLSTMFIAAAMLVPSSEAAGSRNLHGFSSNSFQTATNNDGSVDSSGGGSTPIHSKTHSTISSEVTCKSKAKSFTIADSKDAHVDAVANAVAIGCTSDIYGNWVGDFQAVFKKKSAYAFAEAVSSASAECKSSGNAYGCATAFAYAKAWAKAVASAHADAFALAFNECTCREHDQVAITSAFGTADSFTKLVAEVEATASVAVCVSGDASASASAIASCKQEVYANVFAKAIANAVIYGACYPKGSKLKAETDIRAKTLIDTWEKVKC